jgi:curved DNA-binding protein CbpA
MRLASHYEALGLTPSSTHEEVRQAYIERALRYHPDRQDRRDVAEMAEAERRMQEANDAWAVLGDRAARAAYDAELVRTGRLPPPEEALPPEPGPGIGVLRLVPIVAVLVVLAAIFVFTAYAGSAGR